MVVVVGIVIVIVVGRERGGGFGVSIVVLVHPVGACTGSCTGHETVSCARAVVVVMAVVVGIGAVGGFRLSVMVLVHSVSTRTGSCASYETVPHARAVLVRFGAPWTWGHRYERILWLGAHSRVLGEAGSLLGVHVVICCSSGHERNGGVVIVRCDFAALCRCVVGVVTTWVDWRLPWLG